MLCFFFSNEDFNAVSDEGELKDLLQQFDYGN